jgi:hypothetical protein
VNADSSLQAAWAGNVYSYSDAEHSVGDAAMADIENLVPWLQAMGMTAEHDGLRRINLASCNSANSPDKANDMAASPFEKGTPLRSTLTGVGQHALNAAAAANPLRDDRSLQRRVVDGLDDAHICDVLVTGYTDFLEESTATAREDQKKRFLSTSNL